MQENLERFGFEERAQQGHLNLARRRMFVRPRLQPPPHPFADPRVLDVHEFRADGIRINPLEPSDHFAQGHLPIVEEEFRRNAEVEIRLSKSKLA